MTLRDARDLSVQWGGKHKCISHGAVERVAGHLRKQLSVGTEEAPECGRYTLPTVVFMATLPGMRPAIRWTKAPERETRMPRAAQHISGRAGIQTHASRLTTLQLPMSKPCPPPRSTLQAPLTATSQLPLSHNTVIIIFTLTASLARANPSM